MFGLAFITSLDFGRLRGQVTQQFISIPPGSKSVFWLSIDTEAPRADRDLGVKHLLDPLGGATSSILSTSGI